MKLLPIFAVALLLASVIPAYAEGPAGDLRDESTKPCINAYYGIGQNVDYVKAYKCFESNKIYEFLIVMQLNGQGVSTNLAKAQDLMNEWSEAGFDSAGSADETSMQALLAARTESKNPAGVPVDYCKDVAQTTYSIGYCTWIQDQLAKQSFDTTMASIRQKLSAGQQALWDKIQKSFLTYARAEAERGADMYAGGSGAGTAYSLQQTYVREQFKSIMKSWFVDMKLQPASKLDLANAEMTMKSAYDAEIDNYVNEYDSPGDDVEFSQTMSDYISSYKAAAKASQDNWVALRNLCIELAKQSNKDSGHDMDWSVRVATALTQNRIAEIKNHPLGG